MNWKSVFSGFALSAFLLTVFFSDASAQRVRLKKSATGVVEVSRRASSAESVRGSLNFFKLDLISSSRAMFSGAETATTCCIRYSSR